MSVHFAFWAWMSIWAVSQHCLDFEHKFCLHETKCDTWHSPHFSRTTHTLPLYFANCACTKTFVYTLVSFILARQGWVWGCRGRGSEVWHLMFALLSHIFPHSLSSLKCIINNRGADCKETGANMKQDNSHLISYITHIQFSPTKPESVRKTPPPIHWHPSTPLLMPHTPQTPNTPPLTPDATYPPFPISTECTNWQMVPR